MVMGASHVPMEMSLSRLRVAESASKSQNRRIPVRNKRISGTAASQLEKNAAQTAVGSWRRRTGAGLGVDAVVTVRVMPLRPARPLRRHRVRAHRLVHCVQPRPEPVQEFRERQRCARRLRVSRPLDADVASNSSQSRGVCGLSLPSAIVGLERGSESSMDVCGSKSIFCEHMHRWHLGSDSNDIEEKWASSHDAGPAVPDSVRHHHLDKRLRVIPQRV